MKPTIGNQIKRKAKQQLNSNFFNQFHDDEEDVDEIYRKQFEKIQLIYTNSPSSNINLRFLQTPQKYIFLYSHIKVCKEIQIFWKMILKRYL